MEGIFLHAKERQEPSILKEPLTASRTNVFTAENPGKRNTIQGYEKVWKSFWKSSSSVRVDSGHRASAFRVCFSFPLFPVRTPTFLFIFLGKSFLSRHHSEGTMDYRTTPWAPGRGPETRPDSPGNPVFWLWTGRGPQEPILRSRQDSWHVLTRKSDSFFWVMWLQGC